MQKVFVSFTSYPNRINTVYQVVESIENQTYHVDEICLWLSKEDFPEGGENLPESLMALQQTGRVKIFWVDDNLKSHKKYYYALQKYPDDIVITIDDDMYYEQTMIETLVESFKLHPNAISARNVHRMYANEEKIAPYRSWSDMSEVEQGAESMDLCAIGVGGVLYPPGCADESWFDKREIKRLAKDQDDIWLKFQEVRLNIPVVFVVPTRQDDIVKGSQHSALMHSNLKGDNDKCVDKLCCKYHDLEIIKSWISQMQQVKTILCAKKQECVNMLSMYKNQEIYILGAGINAESLYLFIKAYLYEIKIVGFIVSNIQSNVSFIDGIPVLSLDDLEKRDKKVILIGVNEQTFKEIRPVISDMENMDWIAVDLQSIKQVYWGLTSMRVQSGHEDTL